MQMHISQFLYKYIYIDQLWQNQKFLFMDLLLS